MPDTRKTVMRSEIIDLIAHEMRTYRVPDGELWSFDGIAKRVLDMLDSRNLVQYENP